MGVGKTTVCQALKEILPNCVFLDGDWCWDADPFQVTPETKEMVIRNICFLLNSFLSCSAYENIVFGWVMDQQSILDSILTGISTDKCRVYSVSLTAERACLEERIRRDVEMGRRDPDALTRSLARIPRYKELYTIKVDTSCKSPKEIANEIVLAGKGKAWKKESE